MSTPIVSLGFRPFFLCASAYAVVSMALWSVMYGGALAVGPSQLAPMYWHAHEMIFGYTLAVIAGFLLTAVTNWTGRPTLTGWPLGLLAVLWCAARLAFICTVPMAWQLAAIADMSFVVLLIVAVTIPIVQVRQWRQLIVLVAVTLLAVGHAFFYVGMWTGDAIVLRWGLYLGFYAIIAYIMIISGRVMPFFIEKATGVTLPYGRLPWITVSSLVLFLGYLVLEVFVAASGPAAVVAGLLCLLYALRLSTWHTPAIWRTPMLGVLYVANGCFVAAFALKAASLWVTIPHWAVIHTFAVGGIGLMSAGMMARVSLGHTGRNVYAPPRVTVYVFGWLLLSLALRVAIPMLWPAHYILWIAAAQLSWMIAFALLLIGYARILRT